MIVFLTTADTEILALSHAARDLPPGFPAVRAANPAALGEPGALAAFLDIAAAARVVVVRLLGGKRAFEPGFAELEARCRAAGVPLVACPGDQQPDIDLAAACTAPPEVVQTVFAYLLHGGVANLRNLLAYLADRLLGVPNPYDPPRELPWEGLYRPDEPDGLELSDYLARHVQPHRPTLGLLFYRAHWMSGNLAFVDALIRSAEAEGANVLPVYCYSLKDETAEAAGTPRVFRRYLLDEAGQPRVDVVVNTLSFSMGKIAVQGPSLATGWSVDFLERLNVPILQAIVATSPRAAWQAAASGLSPIDTAMNVAMPEFDGRIVTVPISFKETVEMAAGDAGSGAFAVLGGPVQRYVPAADRVDYLVRLAIRWARLRHVPSAEKRVALILANYPSRNARLGNAVGLDTPASVIHLLHALAADGYRVENVPESGDALIHALIDRCTYDREFLTSAQVAQAAGHVPTEQYAQWHAGYPPAAQSGLREAWGEPPGAVYAYDGALMMPGLELGSVFVGIQPPRGFGENPIAIYHNPDLPPTHHYLAYYRWLRDVWGAHAVVHVGKHGTLEWLPGKAVGLSEECYPEVALADLPHFYPFIVNNPGEGAQAKRRAHATIVDHLVPAMMRAESYDEITKLEQLMDEYYQVQTLDPKKLPLIQDQIWQTVLAVRLHEDLGEAERPANFDAFLLHMDGYICELKDAQIRDGLHVLGQAPEGEQLLNLLLALTRLDNYDAPSLRAALARALGLDYTALLADRGALLPGPAPRLLANAVETPTRSHGDALEALEVLGRRLLARLADAAFEPAAVAPIVGEVFPRDGREVADVLRYTAERLVPDLRRTAEELGNLLRGLRGEYVPAGPSGAPTRGMANVLPTGRNFYSVDPNTIPSAAAWQVGQDLGRALLDKYLAEEGRYPESVGIVVWGTSAMRTHGEDVAEILYLLGVRPIWQQESRRVRGLEVIPLAELGRPRVDVTVRISGFFRDAFPNLVHLLDQAFERVARLDEPADANYVAAHFRADRQAGVSAGLLPAIAEERALYRVFGSKPGTYGAGILPLLEARNWQTDQDLAAVYTAWGGYAYTRQAFGEPAPGEFGQRFAQIAVASKNQDNREHDIFDSDDYMQYHGGMIATVRALTGRNPRQFFGDSADPQRVRVRDLADEARRVFRTRVVNPRWLASIQRHGYKGAFELAATVDYLFGYDATAQVIEDWMYQRVTEAYVFDEQLQRFLQEKNPWALRAIVERLLEAMERGLWAAPEAGTEARLKAIYLELEGHLEERSAR
ncbi:MAG TPA: cobaltochelatase subunit CobN [Chloroflexota bacterium]|jgi:cobaltochelatase CobN